MCQWDTAVNLQHTHSGQSTPVQSMFSRFGRSVFVQSYMYILQNAINSTHSYVYICRLLSLNSTKTVQATVQSSTCCRYFAIFGLAQCDSRNRDATAEVRVYYWRLEVKATLLALHMYFSFIMLCTVRLWTVYSGLPLIQVEHAYLQLHRYTGAFSIVMATVNADTKQKLSAIAHRLRINSIKATNASNSG